MTRPVWTPAYLGLGSNLGDSVAHLRSAIAQLNDAAHVRVYRTSALVRSAPLDGSDQPDYVNAVVALLTQLTPANLLHLCQAIESRHGRVRTGEQWSARTLDMDILVFGTRVLDDPQLHIPHPQLTRRAFVLGPFLDVAPDLDIPGHGRVKALAATMDLASLRPL